MRVKDALGRFGEDLAVRQLESAGMVVLERNWRSHDRELPGEIDVIARDGGSLVVCEVKTRSSLAFGTPAEAVTADKQARLRRLGMAWLCERGLRVEAIRFDVVSVVRGRDGVAVEHLRGAF